MTSSNVTTPSVTIPAFELPPSYYLSDTSRHAIAKEREHFKHYGQQLQAALAALDDDDWPARRAAEADTFYPTDLYKALRQRYPVTLEQQTIGGVPCEVFTPEQGLPAAHQNRVLINFHGGGFMHGGRTNSHLESAPMAALMQTRVISVDYRMAPEHCFPAAGEDAEAVYRALLEQYSPSQIGLFGTSAGAELITVLLARLRQQALPKPAAIGLIACGAFYWRRGDYAHIGPALVKGLRGVDVGHMDSHPYFKQGITADNPEAFPGLEDQNLAAFPPALLISSTRDYVFSVVVHTHRQLLRQGVPAELQVWEGLEHGFHCNPWLPEADEMHRQLAAFFTQRLPAAAEEA